AAWIARTPIFVHPFHGFSFHDFMSVRRRAAYLFLERLAQPAAAEFVEWAPQIEREPVERRLARPGQISVVPSAVELDEIPFETDPTVRAELGISESSPLIGTVGRLDFQKSPVDFVRMAALVAQERPDARFVMVGDGTLEHEAREEAAKLGAPVLFTGFRPDADVRAVGRRLSALVGFARTRRCRGRAAAPPYRPIAWTPDPIGRGWTHEGCELSEMLIDPEAPTFDARALNWRFVTPSEPTGMLLLPAENERISWAVTPFETAGALAEAFRSGPYPGVAIPDLHRWARIADIDAVTLLGAAAGSLAAGGWLYAGFANPWYPLRSGRGSLRLGKAPAVLRRQGLTSPDVALVFPDQRRPAYLLPRDGRLELEFFL